MREIKRIEIKPNWVVIVSETKKDNNDKYDIVELLRWEKIEIYDFGEGKKATVIIKYGDNLNKYECDRWQVYLDKKM